MATRPAPDHASPTAAEPLPVTPDAPHVRVIKSQLGGHRVWCQHCGESSSLVPPRGVRDYPKDAYQRVLDRHRACKAKGEPLSEWLKR